MGDECKFVTLDAATMDVGDNDNARVYSELRMLTIMR